MPREGTLVLKYFMLRHGARGRDDLMVIHLEETYGPNSTRCFDIGQ
jgi:hypothetical protein